jgi:predicted transcriptional regulator
MESILYQNRPQYYQAIEDARKANDSGVFIEFTLSAILEIITEQAKHQVKHEDKHQVALTDTQIAVLKSLKNKTLPRKEIFAAIEMNGDSRSFKRHAEPLLTEGFIEMTVPDKPNSRLQKYRLTDKGKMAISTNGGDSE